MTLRSDVLKTSVTKDDHPTEAGRRGAVISYYFGSPLMQGLVSLPPDPPNYWSTQRDGVLRATLHAESMWADAVYLALTKISSLAWDVKGSIPLRVKRAQELFSLADDEGGWVQALQKHGSDFLLTDNGAFLEIVRESSAAGSRIVGLIPLDSQRCVRTGDPDVPVIYRDRQQRYHEMKYWQVITMADMPSSSETYWGVGFCAASRAYKAIRKLAALEAYVTEKITGQRPLSLNFVSNVSQQQIDEAVAAAKDQAAALGRSIYMGAVIIANIDPTAQAGVSSIDLAGLPDGFVADEERKMAQLIYANALGLDPQDINPALLASKALGTGAQSSVIDAKASGKGLVSYRQQLTHKLDWEVLDEATWFYFRERDLRDEKARADIDYVQAQANDLRIKNLTITPRESRQLDVDNDLLPPEFMPEDFTATSSLSDTDKPVKAELQGAGGAPTYVPPNAAQVPEPTKPNPLKSDVKVTPKEEGVLIQFKPDRTQELKLLERIASRDNAAELKVLKEMAQHLAQMPRQFVHLEQSLMKSQMVQSSLHLKEVGASQKILGLLERISVKNEAHYKRLLATKSAEQKQIVRLGSLIVGQKSVGSRILERDAAGRALQVERQLANGEAQTFDVHYDEKGRAVRLTPKE